jgi:ribosome-associated translation inhibitor RaiA
MKTAVELPEPILTVRGDFGDGLAELVTRKLAAIARHAHEPVLAIRVELYRHHDPAIALPVAAKANVDVNGRQVHAAATGRTARDAMDRTVDRLVRQMDDRPHKRRRRRARTTTSPPRPRRGERSCVPETS